MHAWEKRVSESRYYVLLLGHYNQPRDQAIQYKQSSPEGEGMHFKHLPQVHLPPTSTDCLFILILLASLEVGGAVEGAEPGRATIRPSMASLTTFVSIIQKRF